MKTFCILIATVLLCGNAHARLGETPDEIERRYGKPKRLPFGNNDYGSGLPLKVYQFKGYEITVVFKDNKCVREEVMPAKATLNGDDCFELVKAITGDTNIVRGDKLIPRWRGEGWNATGGPMLIVETKIYEDAVAAHRIAEAKRKESEAKKKADGF